MSPLHRSVLGPGKGEELAGECRNLLDLLPCHLRVDRKRHDSLRKGFGDREISPSVAQRGERRKEMKRDRVVNQAVDAALSEMFLEASTVSNTDDEKVVDMSDL